LACDGTLGASVVERNGHACAQAADRLGRLGRFNWCGKLTRQLPAEMTRLEQWQFVALALNAWLEIISFRQGLRITPDERAEFVLSISPQDFSQLLAVLSLELLFQVTGAKRLLTCSSCGSPYIPKRLPTRGERTYCLTCGTRAALRDAGARWRKRNPNYFRRADLTREKTMSNNWTPNESPD
jgi:hypothetical protein